MFHYVEVCGLLCVNDEEKSGAVVDISCVFRIILNSVLGQRPIFPLPVHNQFPVHPDINSPPSLPGKLCFNFIG